jgi:hypothetical protein
MPNISAVTLNRENPGIDLPPITARFGGTGTAQLPMRIKYMFIVQPFVVQRFD